MGRSSGGKITAERRQWDAASLTATTESGRGLAMPRIYRELETDPRRPPPEDIYNYTEATSTVTDEKSNCMAWARYTIFAANVVFILVGTTIMTLGAWLRTDSRFRDFLSERYRQAVEEAFWEAPTLYAFSYILIVLGAVMIVVAFFGCCGVTVSARVILVLYAILVFALFVTTVSAGIFIFYKKDGIDVELSDALTYMVQHYYQGPGIVQESLDRLQQTFRCCGNSGCADFRVFRQDIPRSCDIRCDGCHYRIYQALMIGFAASLVVFFFVVVLQVAALCCAVYMILTPRSRDVRILYISDHANAAYQSSPPSYHRQPVSNLTRENLDKHNLPFSLRKSRSKNFRY